MALRFPGEKKTLYLLLALGLLVVVIGIMNPILVNGFGKLRHQPKQEEQQLLAEGRRIFRYDTFGSEDFWGRQLRLHEAIKGAGLGGVGPGLSPRAALSLGLKVDAEALPASLVKQLKKGEVNLEDPATTVALLKLDAVVGVKGFFDGRGQLVSVGIQCALCHSTVDDSLAPGIGRRLDGWANRDLNVGAIVALAPNLEPISRLLGVDQQTVREVLRSWGPGKYDALLVLDGKAFRPDGQSAAVLIPLPSDWPALTCTPGPVLAPFLIGTPLWPSCRCTAWAPFTTSA